MLPFFAPATPNSVEVLVSAHTGDAKKVSVMVLITKGHRGVRVFGRLRELALLQL